MVIKSDVTQGRLTTNDFQLTISLPNNVMFPERPPPRSSAKESWSQPETFTLKRLLQPHWKARQIGVCHEASYNYLQTNGKRLARRVSWCSNSREGVNPLQKYTFLYYSKEDVVIHTMPFNRKHGCDSYSTRRGGKLHVLIVTQRGSKNGYTFVLIATHRGA